jgi:hypothetical protein
MKGAVDVGPSEAHDHIRQFPLARFPAKKAWKQSIQKVMIANSLEKHSYHHLDYLASKQVKKEAVPQATKSGKRNSVGPVTALISGFTSAVATAAEAAAAEVEEVGAVLTRSAAPSTNSSSCNKVLPAPVAADVFDA